jgi:hypothetical protein
MKGIKTGGRTLGTPNRLTQETRELLKDILHQELEELPAQLKQMPARERLEVVIKLLPYTLPKVEAVTHKTGEPLDWDFNIQ